MYLLDTCVISEARRHSRPAVTWLQSTRPETLFLSAITVGEIMKGVTMKLRTDPPAAAVLLRWLDELRVVYASRILPINDEVATSWGRLMADRSRPVVDTLIAATARVHNKVVVTRNVVDFADAGVTVLNPWSLEK
jgi:predicted nucleic acid-binding protein